MQVSFQATPKKFIRDIQASKKTPRSVKREDLLTALNYIGYPLNRVTGDHFYCENNTTGDIFGFSFKRNGEVDPKVAKQFKELLQKLNWKSK